MSARVYEVLTDRFGTVLRAADNLKEARTWARHAFPGAMVRPHFERRRPLCYACQSRPCCCRRDK